MQKFPQYEVLAGNERRRTPRYVCGGRAQITCVPSDGAVLSGRLRNLGMGGCYIETASPLQLGARTEVLVQVNTLCFRAMSLVRAVRISSGIGVEFIRLSAGGHSTLAELILDLKRLQALLSPPFSRSQEDLWIPSQDVWLSSLPKRSLPVESPPARESAVPGQSPEDSPTVARCRRILESHPLANVLDLFG